MKKSIRKPQNWQDFETLCKKLWSEEFGANFKKNGRNGQKQNGVDVYGIPKGKENYWGIQCKLKMDSGRLSEQEIENEIAFAEGFEPPLEHLIIASTYPKDVGIEKFVRIEDVKRRKQGKFGIELYCWEDIEDILSENYQTYQWYLHNLDVQRNHTVKVAFEGGESEIVIYPKFFRKVNKYVHVSPTRLTESEQRRMEVAKEVFENIQVPNLDLFHSMRPMFDRDYKVNRAWCPFKVLFENCGGASLKHWELRFYIDSRNGVFDDPDEKGDFFMPAINVKRRKIEWEHEVLYYDPDHYPFVQNDSRLIELSVRPNLNIEEIVIVWELLAEDFTDQGKLLLKVRPEIVEKEEVIQVHSKKKERIEEMPLEHFFDPA